MFLQVFRVWNLADQFDLAINGKGRRHHDPEQSNILDVQILPLLIVTEYFDRSVFEEKISRQPKQD